MAAVSDIKARIAEKARGCPFHTQGVTVLRNQWWPDQLNLKALGKSDKSDPTSSSAKTYAEEFATLDMDALKKDVMSLMTSSQEWWPADYGHYGPFFVRMAWHSAGTYRTFDGRGGGGTGNLRFAPLNSWPDNGNLDKAKRLLWPLKKKYGRKISWGDLMIFTGNCAIESMGLKPFGFGAGRIDAWEPEDDIYWGPEQTWLAAERGGLGKDLDQPLGAVQMGLIYVNPQGPGGNPDPLLSAKDIRETFARMAMNDEETVALIAGGHTFGKCHGAADPEKYVGPEPEGATMQEQGLGWTNSYQSGKGGDTITSGLEGAWTAEPTKWDNGYFANLFKYDWELTKSPAGAQQWIPTDRSSDTQVPEAHDASKRVPPIMLTSDMALKMDPAYAVISKDFYENPDKLSDAFARAWYKLTHRDMGPVERLLGKEVPAAQVWQDPVPAPLHKLVGAADVENLKTKIIASGLSISQLIKTAWGSATTFRCTDLRGGTNGARLRLAPQKDWAVNEPDVLSKVLSMLDAIQKEFNEQKKGDGVAVSMADLIVLGGCAAIEDAAKAAGRAGLVVPFSPGRGDASDEQTDAPSFGVLEPTSDGFRNYVGPTGPGTPAHMGASPEALLVDRAQLMTLNKTEMTVLVGGMRALDANTGGSKVGVLTSAPGTLTNDFFTNLLDMDTVWKEKDGLYEGCDRTSGKPKWVGSRADLVFGYNSELRAIAEFYACDDAKDAFVADFVTAWTKVMDLGLQRTMSKL